MPMTTAAPTSKPVAESVFTPLNPVERDTIPKIFLGAVERFAARPEAMRYKEGGAWRPLTHRDLETRVTRIAAALESMGIGPGDRVALLSENRPEWAIVDYAATGTGMIDVPLYPTLPANQVEYILNDCEAKAVFCSNKVQLQKVQEIRGNLPSLQLVCCFEDCPEPGVHGFGDLLEAGRQAIEAGRALPYRERALAVERDGLATLIYTSGTTGNPKGVMLTHWNLASNVAGAQQQGVLAPRPDDVALSFLPLSHVFERLVDYWYMDAGVAIAYAESVEKVIDNFGEVMPTMAVSVPRVFEKIYARVTGAPGLKGKIAMWAVGIGGRAVDERMAGRPVGGMLAIQEKIADKLVFSKLRARVGGRLRLFISGGAPLSADIAKFFHAAGLPVYEGYGLTETSPVIAVNGPGKVMLGSVGKVIAGVQVRIADTGEILCKGPNVMKGYWNRPDATAECIDADGWFHTGDVGELTKDGFLRITDRIKNIIVTAGGKNVAPAPLENIAAMSPYVAQVVMIGDRRAFPTMLVVPDFENLAPYAKGLGIDTADRRALVRDPRIRELLEKETIGRLEGFAKYEMPKKITIISEEFSVDGGTLTPTLKVKRSVVERMYRDDIEAMYAGGGASAD
jgi:long-chain acyl-CoA synthetase